jgi:gag-polypeptide of LTR copia-type/Domain of unknown function (DUF4219)
MTGFGKSSIGHMTLSKLTKSNYDNWSIQIKALFEVQNVWDIVETVYVEPKNPSALAVPLMKALKEKRVADKTTLYILYQGVDEVEFEKITEATTSKETWGILQTTYKGAESVKQVRVQTLRGEFEILKMKNSKGVSDYIMRVQTVANQLKRNGENLTEIRIVEKILRSLIYAFENAVCAIEESKDLNELLVDELASSLMTHEQRKKLKKKRVT